MSFASEWIRRARARHRAREHVARATTVRVVRGTMLVHPRHGKTLAFDKLAHQLVALDIFQASAEPPQFEVTIPGTLVHRFPLEDE